MNVTVFGAGPGALAFAGILSRAGHRVTLCELPRFAENIRVLADTRLVRVLDAAEGTEFAAALHRVTTDAGEALTGAGCAFIVTHAAAHDGIARAIASASGPKCPIVLSPGYVGGSTAFLAAMERCAGSGPDRLDIAETQVLPWACRKTAPDTVRIGAAKKSFLAGSALPASRSAALALLSELFGGMEFCADTLEAGLNETNFIVHPAIALANLDRVRRGEPWRFYREGFSEESGRLIEDLDAERLAVGRALGLRMKSLAEWFRLFYADQGMRGDSVRDQLSTFPPFADSQGPRSTAHRYFTEDIPFGLVPLSSLGRLADEPTPITDALIAMGSSACGTDFAVSGRILERAAAAVPGA